MKRVCMCVPVRARVRVCVRTRVVGLGFDIVFILQNLIEDGWGVKGKFVKNY